MRNEELYIVNYALCIWLRAKAQCFLKKNSKTDVGNSEYLFIFAKVFSKAFVLKIKDNAVVL